VAELEARAATDAETQGRLAAEAAALDARIAAVRAALDAGVPGSVGARRAAAEEEYAGLRAELGRVTAGVDAIYEKQVRPHGLAGVTRACV
jgi:hypothetical protein